MTVFWDVAPKGLVEVHRHFRGACRLHHQGDESSVNFYQTTRRNIPQDSHFRIRRRQNLKSHQSTSTFQHRKCLKLCFKQTKTSTNVEQIIRICLFKLNQAESRLNNV
jgi:hypothetical protein